MIHGAKKKKRGSSKQDNFLIFHILNNWASVTESLILRVHPLQRSGDSHGRQLDFHRPATLPGRHYGLDYDCFGDPSHWIW